MNEFSASLQKRHDCMCKRDFINLDQLHIHASCSSNSNIKSQSKSKRKQDVYYQAFAEVCEMCTTRLLGFGSLFGESFSCQTNTKKQYQVRSGNIETVKFPFASHGRALLPFYLFQLLHGGRHFNKVASVL